MKPKKSINCVIALIAIFGFVGLSESETLKKGYWWGEPYQTDGIPLAGELSSK